MGQSVEWAPFRGGSRNSGRGWEVTNRKTIIIMEVNMSDKGEQMASRVKEGGGGQREASQQAPISTPPASPTEYN